MINSYYNSFSGNISGFQNISKLSMEHSVNFQTSMTQFFDLLNGLLENKEIDLSKSKMLILDYLSKSADIPNFIQGENSIGALNFRLTGIQKKGSDSVIDLDKEARMGAHFFLRYLQHHPEKREDFEKLFLDNKIFFHVVFPPPTLSELDERLEKTGMSLNTQWALGDFDWEGMTLWSTFYSSFGFRTILNHLLNNLLSKKCHSFVNKIIKDRTLYKEFVFHFYVNRTADALSPCQIYEKGGLSNTPSRLHQAVMIVLLNYLNSHPEDKKYLFFENNIISKNKVQQKLYKSSGPRIFYCESGPFPSVIKNCSLEEAIKSLSPLSVQFLNQEESSSQATQTQVEPLETLLEKQPKQGQDAEKLFKILSEKVFLNKDSLVPHLTSSRGAWRFNSKICPWLVDTLSKFLEDHSTNRLLALSIIQEFLNHMPVELTEAFLKNQCQPNEELIIDLIHQTWLNKPIANIPIPLGDELLDFAIPILLELKSLEFANMPLSKFQKDHSGTPKQIPSFFIIQKSDFSKVHFLAAHFGKNGLLEGLSMDFEKAVEDSTIKQALMEIREEEPSTLQENLILESIEVLKSELENSSDRIPPFLILQTYFSENNPTKQKKSGIKRTRDPLSQPKDQRISKRLKTIPEIIISTPKIAKAVKTSKVVKDSLSVSFAAIGWNNLWVQTSLNSLERVNSKISNHLRRKKNLFSTKPLEYPILDLMSVVPPHQEFFPLNPLLKPYQAESVAKLLEKMEQGISPLLSWQMGSGKSYAINEWLMQQIGRGKSGIFFVILPLSIGPQMFKEVSIYQAVVSAMAWVFWKRETVESQLPEFQANALRKIKKALEERDVYQLLAYLPLFAMFDEHQMAAALYDVLPNPKDKIWSELSQILAAQLPLLLGGLSEELTRQMHTKACELVFSNHKDIEEWQRYFAEAPLEKLLPGNDFKDWKLISMPLFMQLRLAGALMQEVFLLKNTKIPDSFLVPLTNHMSRNIALCQSKEEFTAAIEAEKKVIISSYEVFKKTPKELFNGIQIAGISFDEAQRMHTFDSMLSKTSFNLIKYLKEQNPELQILLSTATPFENRFSELWTLLRLANPSESIFSKSNFNELSEKIEKTQKCVKFLADPDEEKDETKIFEFIIKSFAHLESFRSTILPFVVDRLKRDDTRVIQDWGGAVPKRNDIEIQGEISALVKERLAKALNTYKNQGDQLSYSHTIDRILLDPTLNQSSLNLKDPEIQNILTLFASGDTNEIEKWIARSPRFSKLLSSSVFLEMVNGGENGLFFSEYKAESEILRLAIQFRHPQVEVRLFSGDLKTDQRTEVLKWFKNPSQPNISKALILLKKAGGVGLNLPEASKIFRISDNWNPFVDAQAEDRANRINKAALRTFVTMKFDTFRDEHLRTVREVKKAMDAFFNQRTDVNVVQQFHLFCNLILEQCYQSELNASKDIQAAKDKRKLIKVEINKMIRTIQREDLLTAVETSKPKSKYISTIQLADASILPMAYGTPIEEVIKRAFLVEGNTQWRSIALQVSNPMWREELRKGVFSESNREEKVSIWNEQELLAERAAEHSIDKIRKNHTLAIYGEGLNGQSYQLQKIENPGMQKTIFLYRKQTAQGRHYDILIF